MQKGELWDIVDSERNFLRRSRRGNPIYSGEFHVNVSVWTISPDRRALLTLRAPDKPIYPNFWENTGGAALAGESSAAAAVRELREETGIRAEERELSLIDTEIRDRAFYDIFIVCKGRDIPIRLQEGETVDYQWVDLRTLDIMAENASLALPIARRYFLLRDIIAGKMEEYARATDN